MDNIIKHIYKSCDSNNTNLVPASSLVEFIKPYMPENLSELQKLQEKLDPNNTDPCISTSFFDEIMSDWIAQIKEQDLSNSFSEISNNCLSPGENTSLTANMSANSNNASNNNNTIATEEQIQKLQHQLHKTMNELELVKQQLAVSEEQNEALAANLDKMQKQHQRDQQIVEEVSRSKHETDDIKEEAESANKKIQRLSKLVTNLEREQEILRSEITELENKNAALKEKMQKCEKIGVERRKSLSEFKDELDVKETEISSLMEIIENLQSKLDEKTELVNFYINENKFIKQKAMALESLLHDTFPENVSNDTFQSFNTPKLMRQLSHPITPSLMSPTTSFKSFNTSSPIMQSNISPIRNDSPGADLLKSAGMVTVLRTPYKTLKEEMLEISDETIGDNEIKRLKEVLKHEELIKNSLWDNMKHLSNDNEMLQKYRRDYDALVVAVQEKDETIQKLKCELEASNSQTKFSLLEVEEKSTGTDGINKADQCSETDEKVEEQKEEIRRLEHELKFKETRLHHEKSINSELMRKLEKSMSDKCVDTGDLWAIPVGEIPENKRTNYAKQQMKLERLLEKHEKIENELSTERGINTTLTLKLQELREESSRIKEKLSFYCEKTAKQKEILAGLVAEKRTLAERLEVLEMENSSLHKENLDLKEEKKDLANEKYRLSQSLQNALSRLAMESALANSLRAENDHLAAIKKQCELKLQEECIREIHWKKQVMDLKAANNSIVVDLQRNLAEKSIEIERLRKHIEVININVFLSVNNSELGRINESVLSRFKTRFYDELDHDLIHEVENSPREENSDLEKQMVMLKNNVKMAKRLLEIFSTQFGDLLENYTARDQNTTYSISDPLSETEFQANSTPCDEDFLSCLTDLSISVQEYLEVIPLSSDSFLDNLGLNDEDLRELSRKELEDKFTSLALTLTLDFSSTERRFVTQKEKCNRLLTKFFTYLNYSTDLIRRLGHCEKSSIHKTAITYLELLKNLSEDVFKSAVQCGVFQYEKRTVNCWNLVINYVAALSLENKQVKVVSGDVSCNTDREVVQKHEQPVSEKDTLPLTLPRLPIIKQIRCFVSVVFLLIFVLLIILVFYVDYLCPKDKYYVCPIEWIMNNFVQRIHSNHIL